MTVFCVRDVTPTFHEASFVKGSVSRCKPPVTRAQRARRRSTVSVFSSSIPPESSPSIRSAVSFSTSDDQRLDHLPSVRRLGPT